jgi:aminoglycoside phosphotransferase (APT) family kinase protein
LDRELARTERTLDQFALMEPRAYFLLRELIAHLKEKLKKLPEEEWLPTHGDYKYDQLLHDNGRFSLIDFDFFALAENSFDLGKFCAYLVPSMPKSWEQSVAAEEGRKAFLDRYRQLRPAASLQRFPIYETVNLAGRAMTLMWAQTRGWEQAAEALLVIGMERLKSRLP